MDKIDQKLIQELDKNPRATLTKLSKKLRTSQQVVDYRIKRLKEKTITQFGTVLNLRALDKKPYRVFFTFNSNINYSDEKILDYFKSKEGIYSAARIGGKYDFQILVLSDSFNEYEKFINDIHDKFPGIIRGYDSCYAIDHCIYKYKFMSKDYSEMKYGSNEKMIQIDETDRLILSEIKNNCRYSSVTLGNKIGITYKTVLNRIKNLEKNKIILGYRVKCKFPDKMLFLVLFTYKNYSQQKEKEVLRYIKENDQITSSSRLFGKWNLLLYAYVDDNKQLQKTLMEIRDKFEVLNNFEILPVFERIPVNFYPL